MPPRRFCYTLDVVTDGSEHTGCGTLFLSVWKIPLSVSAASAGGGEPKHSSESDDASDSACSSDSNDSSGSSGSEGGNEEEDEVDQFDEAAEESKGSECSNDPVHSWLTGDDIGESTDETGTKLPSHHDPGDALVARYALSGAGDALARLCADQRFKLARTRACFLPSLGRGASDGLSALFLALHGAGAPSLHVVVPSSFERGFCRKPRNGGRPQGGDTSGGAFVEELATIALGAHKAFDIRTCEVRSPSQAATATTATTTRPDSFVWWKVYEDEHLLVHASSCIGPETSSAEGSDPSRWNKRETSASSSLVFLYSFRSPPKGESGLGKAGASANTAATNSYCTLALFPPCCGDAENACERLVQRSTNLPVLGEGIPMSSIDYVIFLDPKGHTVGMTETDKPRFFRWTTPSIGNSRVLVTLPQANGRHPEGPLSNHRARAVADEGILVRSQQLHRRLYGRMPRAFVEPPGAAREDSDTGNKAGHAGSGPRTGHNGLVLQSGTSLVLEKASRGARHWKQWNRKKSIWNKEPRDEWTRGTLDTLRSFLRPELNEACITPGEDDDKNEKRVNAEQSITDQNEIELDEAEEEEIEMEKTDSMIDQNEIELEDEGEESSGNDKGNERNKPPLITGQNKNELEDENEIDLDDENDVPENDPKDGNDIHLEGDGGGSSIRWNGNNTLHRGRPFEAIDRNVASRGRGPRLLVLGTGCATPSAYRGASGYALVLPSPGTDPERGRGIPRQHYCYRQHTNHSSNGFDQPQRIENEAGDQIYLLDCGEGASTMLSRNCGHITDWSTRVRGIWISHSHLDHYGGLPTLLRILSDERKLQEATFRGMPERTEHPDTQNRKRPRQSPSATGADSLPAVPWVVAPAKVLRYLDLILDCHHGRSRDGTHRFCFEPRPHHDPRIPSGPFFHFENVKVYHNCCPAFGLLLGWKTDSESDPTQSGKASGTRRARTKTQFMCYSGDTRPSHNLVRACRRALQRCGQTSFRPDRAPGPYQNPIKKSGPVDLFLIHEATYREAESAMAYQKKHSTLSEARMVATDTGCSRVLMSHFSQRYDNTTKERKDASERPESNNGSKNNSLVMESTPTTSETNPMNAPTDDSSKPIVGLAADGLWIALDH